MKKLALLPVLLLTLACSSATKLSDDRVFDCSPGQDLEVNAGLEAVGNRAVLQPGEEAAFLVEVANNSHEDVTIASIRIDPSTMSKTTVEIEPTFSAVNYELAQGKDHLFRFPTRVRTTPLTEPQPQARSFTSSASLRVTLTLTNGDAYRCSFSMSER